MAPASAICSSTELEIARKDLALENTSKAAPVTASHWTQQVLNMCTSI